MRAFGMLLIKKPLTCSLLLNQPMKLVGYVRVTSCYALDFCSDARRWMIRNVRGL